MTTGAPPPGPTLAEAPLGGRPLALVLSGGASLSAWQAGVLCSLAGRHGLSFQAVAGTSGGSINGFAYAASMLGRVRELWRDVPRREFLRLSPGLRPPRLFSQRALRAYLSTMVDDDRCRAAWRCWLYVVSCDVANGVTLQAEYSPEPGGPWTAPILDHLLGSMAVPFLFAPVAVPPRNGSPRRVLVDGHLSSFVDLRVLAARGARDFLFINVAPRGRDGLLELSPRRFASTLLQQLLTAQVDNAVAAAGEAARRDGLRFFEFAPQRPLRMRVFGFDRSECRAAFDQGEAEAGDLVSGPGAFQVAP